MQIAKSWGAEVTCVDSAKKLDMLRSIGADQVIDYTQEDFTKRGERYDVIFDVVGRSPYFTECQIAKTEWTLSLSEPRRVTYGSRAMDFNDKRQEGSI